MQRVLGEQPHQNMCALITSLFTKSSRRLLPPPPPHPARLPLYDAFLVANSRLVLYMF